MISTMWKCQNYGHYLYIVQNIKIMAIICTLNKISKLWPLFVHCTKYQNYGHNVYIVQNIKIMAIMCTLYKISKLWP